MYLLDANVLITAHEDYYPIDRVPQFWDWTLAKAEAGIIKMPYEIHAEIAVSNGPLKDWICAPEVKKALVLNESIDPVLLQQVLDVGYGTPLTDSDMVKIGQDAFLVAYGLVSAARTIITKEVSKPSKKLGNRKVPDVCNDVGVKWMRDFDLYKQLNFKTA